MEEVCDDEDHTVVVGSGRSIYGSLSAGRAYRGPDVFGPAEELTGKN